MEGARKELDDLDLVRRGRMPQLGPVGIFSTDVLLQLLQGHGHEFHGTTNIGAVQDVLLHAYRCSSKSELCGR